MCHTATLLLLSLYNNPSYYNIAHNIDTTQATTPAAQYTPVVGILIALLGEGEVLEVLEILEVEILEVLEVLVVVEVLEVLEILEVEILEVEILEVLVLVVVPQARQSEVGQVPSGSLYVNSAPNILTHELRSLIAYPQAVLTGSWKARHTFWGKGLHRAAPAVISVLTLSVTQASLSQAQ